MDDFIIHSDDVIQHFGVKGMKWGKRLRDNHVQNLEYKYRKLGYNEEQVKQKLAKRLRNEKIALGAVGAAGAAVAGYMLKNKIQDDFIGRTLKKGKTFDSVNAASKIDTSRPVYGAYRKNDKVKYRGMYGMQRKMRRAFYGDDYGLGDHDNIYKFKAVKDVKIAPNRAAKKSFKKLYKTDSEFRSVADEIASQVNKSKNKYNNFNVGLVARGHDDRYKKNIDKFYSSLKKKGYDGLNDINDKKYSGYKTKNPTIFFDHKNLKVASKKLLTNDTIEKDYDKTMKILSVQNNAGKVAGFSTAVAGLATYSSHRNNNDVRKNDEEYNKKYGKKVRK